MVISIGIDEFDRLQKKSAMLAEILERNGNELRDYNAGYFAAHERKPLAYPQNMHWRLGWLDGAWEVGTIVPVLSQAGRGRACPLNQ